MINVLIADDDINYATNLLNYLTKYNTNVRVCGITKDGKETIDKLNQSENIDIVLLDLKMPIYNGQEVLSRIKNQFQYKRSCIIISGEISSINSLRTNEMICGIYYKTIGIDKILLKISEIAEYKESLKKSKELKSKIIDELLYLGYDSSHRGTQYLIKVIDYIITHPFKELEKLEKNIYTEVARKYHDSVHNVKCSIIRATNSMYYECEIDKLKEYFCFADDMKPTAKVVINTVVNKILYSAK